MTTKEAILSRLGIEATDAEVDLSVSLNARKTLLSANGPAETSEAVDLVAIEFDVWRGEAEAEEDETDRDVCELVSVLQTSPDPRISGRSYDLACLLVEPLFGRTTLRRAS